LKSISKAILQEPVDFTVEINRHTLLHKLHIKKTEKVFVIYPLCLGTLLLIAKNLMEFKELDISDKDKGVTFDSVVEGIVNNSQLLSRIIALAIWNKKFSDKKLVRYFQELHISRLSSYIESNLASNELLTLTNVVIKQMEIDHFLACMGLAKGMEIVKDTPTPTGPTNNEEISGEL
jgi:hypothetical protein